MRQKVTISSGRIHGFLDDGVPCFLGIPYAAPPIGERRFLAPAPPEPWSHVFDATKPGPVAPQPPPLEGLSIPGDPTEQSEDCLTLNVWTPKADDARRPVMVFIHGGSFISGTGASSIYRGRWLAERGDVVVVTINYRLGALGFLAHRALVGADGSVGNYGLLDQVAALRWVHENIASFGGDPANVTLFGESAGAMSTCALLAAPSARGLFHKAVIESGPPFAQRRDRALEVGDELARILELELADGSSLRTVPADELVAGVGELQRRPPSPGEIALPLLPVIDGVFLPDDPFDAIVAGSASSIPLMAGTNKDEMTMFSLGDPKLAGMDEHGLASWLELAMPGCAPHEIIAAYRDARSERGERIDPPALWVAIAGDVIFRWPTLQIALAQQAHQPSTYLYLFTQETSLLGGILGACHALELPYVFGTLRNEAIGQFIGAGVHDTVLSNQMADAWIGFARSGTPAIKGGWAPLEPTALPTRVFGPHGGDVSHPRAEELGVLDRFHPRRTHTGA